MIYSKYKKLNYNFSLVILTVIFISSSISVSAASFRERDLEARAGKVQNRTPPHSNIDSSYADEQLRVDELEEQLRIIRGSLERSEYENSKLRKEITSMSEDFDLRLRDLESARAGGIAGDANSNAGPSFGEISDIPPEANHETAQLDVKTVERTPPKMSISVNTESKNNIDDANVDNKSTVKNLAAMQNNKGDFKVISPVNSQINNQNINDNAPINRNGQFPIPKFSSAKEHYNYAFTLMNKAQYAEAGQVFDSFLDRYPNHDLTGNVYYWLGETFYVQEKYTSAADSFRQGFEVMPSGIKAPDNLLKLSMSLGRLEQTDQACVVLNQLTKKYNSPETVLQKAQQQINKLNCL